MSTPPPSFNDLVRIIDHQIDHYETKFEGCSDDIKEVVARNISYIKAHLVSINNLPSLSELEIDKSCDFSSKKVREIRTRVFESSADTIFKQEVFRESEKLFYQIVDFYNSASYKKEIDEGRFGSYLEDEEWAQTEFKLLVRENNPWAVKTLSRIILDGKKFGMEVLLEDGIYTDRVAHFKDHPSVQSSIEHLLRVDAPLKEKKQAFLAINAILKYKDCEWAKEIIEKELLSSNPNEQCKHQIIRLFKVYSDHLPWIEPFIVEHFVGYKSWAIEAVYSLICFDRDSKEIEERALRLSRQLISIAIDKPKLQILLTSMATLSDESCIFTEVFEHEHVHFKGIGKDPLLKTLLVDFRAKLALREPYGTFDWESLDPVNQINVLRLYMQRQCDLIGVLTGSVDQKQFINPPIKTCFPKTTHLVMGIPKFIAEGESEKEQSDWTLIEEIAPILNEHQITVEYPASASDILLDKDEPIAENVSTMPKGENVDVWIRDPCLIHERGVSFPKPHFLNSRLLRDQIESLRTSRMHRRLSTFNRGTSFIPIGCVNENFNQIIVLSWLLQNKTSIDDCRFQFTHNEIGNVLIGLDGEEKYALIGKDAVEQSMMSLKIELAQIGLRKVEGRWVLSEPYLATECHLDEEDMRSFFALDMGLRPEQVFFVEQPDYHLDVSMTIIKGKTIVLNDSVRAYNLWCRYAAEKMKDESFEYNLELYKEVDKQLKRYSFLMKQYEDATAQDLERQGFRVIREGGRFKDIFKAHPENHQANFFNFLSLTAPRGEKIIIGMGMEPFFQEEFKAIMQREVPDLHAVYFLDQITCKALQASGGGLHCICKEKFVFP